MKIRNLCLLALFWVTALGVAAQLTAPKLGVARYSDRTVHPVYGLESNVLVNDQLLSDADAISFSDLGGLVSIAGHIELLNSSGAVVAQYNSGDASPVLNIDGALTTAIAWLPSRSSIVYWNGQSFVATEIARGDLPGTVTAVQLLNSGSAKLLASDAAGNVFAVSVSLEPGQVTSVNLLPGVKGPAFLQYSFVVSHDANELHIEAPNGTVRTLPLSGNPVSFERMGTDWVHISSGAAQDWALHLNTTALHVSQLPAPRDSQHLIARPREPQEVVK